MARISSKRKTNVYFVSLLLLLVLYLRCNHFPRNDLFDRKLRKAKGGIPKFPNKFTLEQLIDVPLPKSACFITCARVDPKSTNLTCHFREHCQKTIIRNVMLDGTTFRTISPIVHDTKPDTYKKMIYSETINSITENTFHGEKPRSFVLDGDIYVVDNSAGHNKLVEVGDHGEAKYEVQLPNVLEKKRITPLPLQTLGILFIDFDKQDAHVCTHTGYKIELSCLAFWKEIKWTYKLDETFDPDEWHFQGSTAGIEVKTDYFVGFGHMRQKKQRKIGGRRDIFFWTFFMHGVKKSKAYMFIERVSLNDNAGLTIIEPTSLISTDDKWYLFTTESDTLRNTDGALIKNRVYYIDPESKMDKKENLDPSEMARV